MKNNGSYQLNFIDKLALLKIAYQICKNTPTNCNLSLLEKFYNDYYVNKDGEEPDKLDNYKAIFNGDFDINKIMRSLNYRGGKIRIKKIIRKY